MKYLQSHFLPKFFTLIFAIFIADFLLYKEELGWTLGLFGLVLVLLLCLYNFRNLRNGFAITIVSLTIVQCLVLIEKSNLLSILLICLGFLTLIVFKHDHWKSSALIWFKEILRATLLFGRSFDQAFTALKNATIRRQKLSIYETFFRGWFLSIALSLIFIFLFAQANPLIMRHFQNYDLSVFFKAISVWRLLFWLVMACIIMTIIRPRLKINTYKIRKDKNNYISYLFTESSVIRSLIIFNAIFAVQTLLDVIYLWGGTSLPKGITYSEYAQKGAYPLIITALLSAVFAILSNRISLTAKNSQLLKKLLYLWILQNIFLVISCIFRTLLYIEAYSLTYWRISAIIWMGLVAFGLVFIIIQVLQKKSDTWLINVNVITLLSALFLFTFINWPSFIARYNIMHSGLMIEGGRSLDYQYIIELGPMTIPALREIQNNEDITLSSKNHLIKIEDYLYNKLDRSDNSWRGWTYQKHRILTKHKDLKHIK